MDWISESNNRSNACLRVQTALLFCEWRFSSFGSSLPLVFPIVLSSPSLLQKNARHFQQPRRRWKKSLVAFSRAPDHSRQRFVTSTLCLPLGFSHPRMNHLCPPLLSEAIKKKRERCEQFESTMIFNSLGSQTRTRRRIGNHMWNKSLNPSERQNGKKKRPVIAQVW